jgi:23S rRNA (adenine2503-C2)-methyltransferase
VVRFAVATLIPHPNLMKKFIRLVAEEKIPMKLHLSLHSPDDERRKVIMPSAYSVRESISFVKEFMQKTGGSSEIHYTLMGGVNDSDEDLGDLISLLEGENIPVKFLVYNEKPSVDFTPSKRVRKFCVYLEHFGIKTEFYIPPGGDVGSSCGQFLMEDYAKYNTKKKRSIKNRKAK